MSDYPHDQLPHYFLPAWIQSSDEVLTCEICVYGGTAAGVIAAVAAKQRGRNVILLHPGQPLGGMTTGGLSYTDLGNKAAIGGLSRQFYRDLGKHYGRDEEWKFEPKVAQQRMDQLIDEHDIPVHRGAFLDKVELDGKRIAAVSMLGGLTVKAEQFIDATYEGDLLAKAGVPYHVGRESNAQYGETYNGRQIHHTHQFSHFVDPYSTPGDPASGLLPDVEDAPFEEGAADKRVQAYCFRMCLCDDPANQVPFPKPQGYDADQYELAIRWYNAPEKDRYNIHVTDGHIHKFDRLCVPSKTDSNNNGAFSSDYIGASWDWPDGDYEKREQIFQAHIKYQMGFYYLMANDERIPSMYRDAYAKWGLAADEFTETANWPNHIYVREGRRMVGDYVMTDQDCLGERACNDPVGMGAYQMDSHNCTRMVHEGRVVNEGDVQVKLPSPYRISFRSIVPPAGSIENLTVPVAVSASHIAFGSIRMEPVFMILGESAAIATDLAMRSNLAVRDLPYDELKPALLEADQVLETDVTNEAIRGNP